MVLLYANEPCSERDVYIVCGDDGLGDSPRSEHVALGVGASWTWFRCSDHATIKKESNKPWLGATAHRGR